MIKKKNIRSQAFRNVLYYVCFVKPNNRIWKISSSNMLVGLCAGQHDAIQQMHIDYTDVIMGNENVTQVSATIELLTAYFDKNPIEMTNRLLNEFGYNVKKDDVIDIISNKEFRCCISDDDVPIYERNAGYSMLFLIIKYAEDLNLVSDGSFVNKQGKKTINKIITNMSGSLNDELPPIKCFKALSTCLEQTLDNIQFCVYEDYLEYVYNNYSFETQMGLRYFSDPVFDKMLENIKSIVTSNIKNVNVKSFASDVMTLIKDSTSCEMHITPDVQFPNFVGACANVPYITDSKLSLQLLDLCAVKAGLGASYYNGTYTDADLNNYMDWRFKLFCIELLINDLKSRRVITVDMTNTQFCKEKINPRKANVLIKQLSPDVLISLSIQICADFLDVVTITRNAVDTLICTDMKEFEAAGKRALAAQKNKYELLLKEKDKEIAILKRTADLSKKKDCEQENTRDALTKKDRENTALKNKVSKMTAIIEEMQQYIDEVSELENESGKEKALMNCENITLENEIDRQEDTTLTDAQLEWLREKRIVFVCHHEGMCSKLKDYFPKCSVSINGYGITAMTAKANDFVVFITKDIPHREFFRIKNKCISFDVPYYNANKTNMNMIAAEIYSQAKAECDE